MLLVAMPLLLRSDANAPSSDALCYILLVIHVPSLSLFSFATPDHCEAHGTPVLHKAAERCGERMVALLLKARFEFVSA